MPLIGAGFFTRKLGREGHARQAGDLADALHNLPHSLLNNTVDFERLRRGLRAYHQRYATEHAPLFNYLSLLDEAEQVT